MADPSASPRVLCTMGHGCDLVDRDSKNVPDGCKYITIGLCGMTSIDLPKILYAFRDELLAEALKYPDDPAIKSILSEYFEFPFDTVMRVHNEGDSYTDAGIILWTNFMTTYFKSGIYELGHVPEGPLYMNRENIQPITHPKDADDELYKFVYEGSLWQPKSKNGNINIIYSDLMKRNPAIYYHFACRSVCDASLKNVERYVALKRKQSINRISLRGAKNEEGQMGQIIDPTIHLQKATYITRFSKWVVEHVSIPENREKWKWMIDAALDRIKTRRSPDMNTSVSASAAASSNQSYNPFRQYVGMPAAAASAPLIRRFNMLNRRATPASLSSSLSSMSLSSAAASKVDEVVSSNNDLENYINRDINPPSSATSSSASSEENLMEEPQYNGEANLNEGVIARRAQLQLENQLKKTLESASRRKGGRRNKQKTHRKKTNRKRKQTRKRK